MWYYGKKLYDLWLTQTGLNIRPMPSTVGVYFLNSPTLVAHVHVVWFHEDGGTKVQ